MGTGVIISGAGPVGLMLAGELRLAGVDVTVYEKLSGPSGESRGVGFTRRAAEVFHQRGLLDRLGEIEIGRQGHFGGVRIDFEMLEDNHFGIRGVPQYRIEEVLEAWVGELGLSVQRGCEVTGFRETAEGVTALVETPGGSIEHTADYLVGCDGGRSTIRKAAGIAFPGREATRGMYVADVVGCDIPTRAIGERVPGGMVMAIRLEDDVDRIIIHPDGVPPHDDRSRLTFAEVADSWQSLTGQSLHHAEARWVSAFTNATRQAAEYRRGRVFLCGDSTHIHIPAGAQGLSVGVQDAVNLGWKLAADLQGWAPQGLLDTYHSERHPVGARLVRNTLAQSSLYLTGEEMEPLRGIMRELVTFPDAARHLAEMVSGLDVSYEVGDGSHRLLGRRMPDRELKRADGSPTRVAELLHAARGLLIHSADHTEAARTAAGWSDRVDAVAATWAPSADAEDGQGAVDSVLIRPDGHVVWTSPGGGELADALPRWFGPREHSARR
ncbi:FAD-dependent monooxygenase [Streptomyces sp. N2-109]|uniref:FAD-dependent monooxygenase n=1 Tax=Streptomyces gossypii TaxID=2883101 RepID=A0ABT2JKM2_9ACTN|nr:FAD-dependent monooxygenase [Streptomyces gossypii]MCT2588434.1 FAD-dependent monooxygenase [Streptomyces gossypii]